MLSLWIGAREDRDSADLMVKGKGSQTRRILSHAMGQEVYVYPVRGTCDDSMGRDIALSEGASEGL